MRILFVFSDYLLDWYGGFSSVLFDFISELRRRCDVRCVFLAYKHRNVSFPQGIVDAVFSPECVFEAFSTDARQLLSVPAAMNLCVRLCRISFTAMTGRVFFRSGLTGTFCILPE